MGDKQTSRPTGILGATIAFSEMFFGMLEGVDKLPLLLKIPAYPFCLAMMALVLAVGLILTPIWLPIMVIWVTFGLDTYRD